MSEPKTMPNLGTGQVALMLAGAASAAPHQMSDLIRMSDPALSELGFEELLGELLQRVCDLLGVDTAAILLLDEETDELVARAAKGIEEEVEQGVRIPLGHGFAGRVAKERVAIFIADLDHADVVNSILREKRICSLLGIPLIVEGDLIGVLHVGSLTPRRFDERDLAVLQLAAARAAPAIERARLLDKLAREHRVAVTLQRSLLPRNLGSLAGVAVAARYLPARDEVGGDWYDLVEVTPGRVGVVIGDVVGHGFPAATLMAQLRAALHAYAAEGHPPGRTLELVDRFAGGLRQSAMATVAYALLDGDTGIVRVAAAGHLPPIVVGAGGRARVIELEPHPPLGAFAHRRCAETEFPLQEGETLMMYTDGLVERPRVPLRRGIDELLKAVEGGRSAEEVCLLAMDRMLPARGPRDDIAVIALERTVVPDELRLEIAADPRELAPARAMVRRWLRKQAIDGVPAMEILLAVGEACANAVEHAYGPDRGRFTVSLAREGEWVRVRVRDRGHWRDPRGENRGRGLTIMQAAMDALDITTDEGGTEIAMRRRASAR
jgi:serine phosphatase RsbU (regulator of sigma subunit)/anti-sigma regulatory factor (Ser/Thr protein kinase)